MVDLHLHSSVSDGTNTPEEVAKLASDAGLTAAILTDHDTCAGTERFLAAAQVVGLRSTSGMEFSIETNDPGRTVHILAYGFDCTNPDLTAVLGRLRDSRKSRTSGILSKLTQLGCPISVADVLACAGVDAKGELYSRVHIAAAMVKRGFARDIRFAFDRYLGQGRAAYVDRLRLGAAECFDLVHKAGGMVSLAHPAQIHFNRTELRRYVESLVAIGLDGIECYYSGFFPSQVEEYLGLAHDFNLVATGGSDFHGANKPKIQIGTAYGGLKVPDDSFDAILERVNKLRAASAFSSIGG